MAAYFAERARGEVGLIVTGGAFDVDPALYGAASKHDTVVLKENRTQFELAVTKGAMERDMPLLGRVRESYIRQSSAPGWARINAEQDKDAVTADVLSAVRSRLGLL